MYPRKNTQQWFNTYNTYVQHSDSGGGSYGSFRGEPHASSYGRGRGGGSSFSYFQRDEDLNPGRRSYLDAYERVGPYKQGGAVGLPFSNAQRRNVIFNPKRDEDFNQGRGGGFNQRRGGGFYQRRGGNPYEGEHSRIDGPFMDERGASCSESGPPIFGEQHKDFAADPSQIYFKGGAFPQKSNVKNRLGKRTIEVDVGYNVYKDFAPANKMAKTSVVAKSKNEKEENIVENIIGYTPILEPIRLVYGEELRKMTWEEMIQLTDEFKNIKFRNATLRCDVCNPDKRRRNWECVGDYIKHHFKQKHVVLEKGNLEKINKIITMLICDARLGYARKHGMWSSMDPAKPEMCALCTVPKGEGKNDHMNIKECWINHEYTQPKNCCYTGRFNHRHDYFYHCYSLCHLKKEKVYRDGLVRAGANYQGKEGKAVRPVRRKIMRGRFLEQEGEIKEEFGTLPVPNEVKQLMEVSYRKNLSRPKETNTHFLHNPEVQVTYYDPSIATGKFQVIFETQFQCIICCKEIDSSKQSVIDHCASQEHYDSILGAKSTM